MRIALGAAPLLLSVSAAALLAMSGAASAACTTTGSFTFTNACGQTTGTPFGIQATALEDGSTLTVTDITVDDDGNDKNSFSRIVIKAGDESQGPIGVGLTLAGKTFVDSHNNAGVYVLTQKGDIDIDVGSDVTIKASQSGIFAKADNSGETAGGNIVVTNSGTITAGTTTGGPFGSEGIRVRSLQGDGTIYNYGSVTSTLGRGLRIDTDGPSGGAGGLVVNSGTVNAYLDAVHINAHAGDAGITNGVGGVLISSTQRGAVAASYTGDASLLNKGAITGAAAGSLVWGAGDAVAINSGTITAAAADKNDANDYLNFGIQIWSTQDGKAALTNGEGGSIIADDGWGAWLLSTKGDVAISNAGTIRGKSTAIYVGADKIAEQWEENPQLADYQGAVGGDLTLTNSGVITANNGSSFVDGMALITLVGHDLGSVSVTNQAGGFIGGHFAQGADYSLAAMTQASASELETLRSGAANAALSLVVAADTWEIDNAGTLVGRIAAVSPFDVMGDETPDSSTAGTFDNSGLWVTSGASGFNASLPGTISNSGHIFALGETTLTGDLNNQGAIWIRSAGEDTAYLSLVGDYEGSDAARFVFDIAADGAPKVTLTGAISGQTQVELANLDGWDWKSYQPQTLIDGGDGAAERGGDSFVLATPVRGLVQYDLSYDADTVDWTLSTQVSEQSVGEITQAAQTVTLSVANLTADLLNRTDDLRDGFWTPGDTMPLSYAAAPVTPAQAAIADLEPVAGPAIRSWIKAEGAFGSGGGYTGLAGTTSLGTDITVTDADRMIAAGVFGSLSTGRLSYNASGSTTEMTGQALGAYGTVVTASGLFASAAVALAKTDTDIAISGESAAFGAWTAAGRADLGYRTQMGAIAVEPSLGMRLGASTYDDFTMSDTLVSLDDSQTLSTEARVRLTQSFAHETMDVAPFAILAAGVSQNFDGAMSLSDIGDVGSADQDGLYGSAALGLQVTSLDGKLAAYARTDVTVSQDVLWAGVKIGGAYKF